MSTEPIKRNNKVPIAVGTIGILVELIAIVLLASKRLPTTFGIPLVVVGMFLAFVPIFVAARRARRR